LETGGSSFSLTDLILLGIEILFVLERFSCIRVKDLCPTAYKYIGHNQLTQRQSNLYNLLNLSFCPSFPLLFISFQLDLVTATIPWACRGLPSPPSSASWPEEGLPRQHRQRPRLLLESTKLEGPVFETG
jgi:hypothetical protein